MLSKYLSPVVKGFEWYVIRGEPVPGTSSGHTRGSPGVATGNRTRGPILRADLYPVALVAQAAQRLLTRAMIASPIRSGASIEGQ